MSKKTTIKGDPYADREAANYENPVPSREFIMSVLLEQGKPMTLKQLIAHFGIKTEDGCEGLGFRLRAMERDGQVMRNRRNAYGLISKMDLVSGRIQAHPDGFGFLIPDEGGEDIFLTPKEMRSLLHRDRAVVRKTGVDRRGRTEGALVEVLERHNHTLVGRLAYERGLAFVIPANKRIHQDIAIMEGDTLTAEDGQIVLVEIVEQPNRRSQPIGKVIDVLGDHMAPGMEIDIAVRSHEIPNDWPDEVVAEAGKLKPEVPEEDKKGREDLRQLPLVTIDGEDARDFDDAVYCERSGRGWRLLVAIADVSHYVKPGSALDKEAKLRGNSVYFPGRVIPMLPEAISNGLCSLNPHVDRLCMVCEMMITPGGRVKSARFFEAVMHSHARLTYNQVSAMLVDQDEAVRGQYADLLPHLEELHRLYKALRVQRERRGAIDFETTETRIVFGEQKKIQAVVPVERLESHQMIEEYMVAANVAAAEYLLKTETPALYRVHDGPSKEKLEGLKLFLAELGLKLGGRGEPKPKHYGKFLNEIRERDDARLIQTVLLRSLSQAVYSPDNTGHFGLAYEAYTHFTSPIRRYPDLLIHRALRYLATQSKKPFIYSHADMVVLGEHCSMTERRADEATRDAVDWLKCEFMQDKVGEEFDGIITSVTSFGVFVELKEIYVEGLVHVTSLQNDYYHFDAAKHRLLGERTNKVYRLADPVRIRVVRVNLDEKKIDFELADAASLKASDAPTKKKKRRNKNKKKAKS